MNTSYDREIPKELIKGAHDYIINMFGNTYADFIGSRKDAIKFLQENDLEIVGIHFERNYYGLNDYRLLVRKQSGS